MKGVGIMLVLSRKLNESIIIGDNVRIRIVGVRGNQIRLGIEAPDSVKIFREEILNEPATGRPEPIGRERLHGRPLSH
jgi:carbon storage regulator CsrA